MNIRSFSVLSFLLLFVFIDITAQTERTQRFPDRANLPHQRKADQMWRMDVFSEHTFDPFLSLEGQIGLIGTFSKDLAKSLTPPVNLGLNYRLSTTFSIGAQVGVSSYASEANYFDKRYTTGIETTSRIVQLRFNAHFPLGLRGEAYGGLGAGYRSTDIVATEEAQGNPEVAPETILRPQNGFLSTAHIGARYSLTPRLGLQGEISSGLSLMTVGVNYRLR